VDAAGACAWKLIPGPGDSVRVPPRVAHVPDVTIRAIVAMVANRHAVGRTGREAPSWLDALVGVGYFSVWTLFGVAAFALGLTLATIEMQVPTLARAVPIATGLVVLIAGALQFTARGRPTTLPAAETYRGVAGALSADARTAGGMAAPRYTAATAVLA